MTMNTTPQTTEDGQKIAAQWLVMFLNHEFKRVNEQRDALKEFDRPVYDIAVPLFLKLLDTVMPN